MAEGSTSGPGANAGTSAAVKFVLAQWRRRPVYFPAAMALALVASMCDLAVPWVSASLIDSIASNTAGSVSRLWWALVGLYLFAALARIWVLRFMAVYQPLNMAAVAADAFRKVQSLPSEWHERNVTGGVVGQIVRGMHGYGMIDNFFLGSGATAVLVLVGLLASITFISPLTGAVVAVVVALIIACYVWGMMSFVDPVLRRSVVAETKISAFLSDSLSCNSIVKSFAIEEQEGARLETVLEEYVAAARLGLQRYTLLAFFQNALLTLLLAGLSGLLVSNWLAGRASAGDVAFGLTAFILIGAQLQMMAMSFRQLRLGLNDIEPVLSIMEMTPESSGGASEVDARLGAGARDIVFERVRFRYPKSDSELFAGLNLRIEAGQTVALVGPSGSGKSSLVKLLQRLYDPSDGCILIGGVDISRVPIGSLRRLMAVVPQEPILFNRSIADNIKCGVPNAGDEEIAEAARQALIHDFIAALPDGYGTLVGERGVQISGGERQRIAIARAFLLDAPILIFDEATSALDAETDRLVGNAMRALMQGRTTIVIAHRLSTVRDADRILVLDGGNLVEHGDHQTLLAQKGLYARLNLTENSGRTQVAG